MSDNRPDPKPHGPPTYHAVCGMRLPFAICDGSALAAWRPDERKD